MKRQSESLALLWSHDQQVHKYLHRALATLGMGMETVNQSNITQMLSFRNAVVLIVEVELLTASLEDILVQTGVPIIFLSEQANCEIRIACLASSILQKPLRQEQVRVAIEKAWQTTPCRNNVMTAPRLSIFTREGMEYIPLNQVLWCEADSNYTCLYLATAEMRVVAKSLIEYEKILGGYDFCRIHRSYLVNLLHVVKVFRGKSHQAEMVNGKRLSVAANRKEAFLDQLRRISLG
ncbi:MAG: LytTR family DNA-binding domain-containing protein [Bacteroidota bacterium]